MLNVKDILDGLTNEMLGLNKNVSKPRLEICKKCQLYKETALGPVCNSKLCVNQETGEISKKKLDGFICGCGCRLNAKTTLMNASCPLNKW